MPTILLDDKKLKKVEQQLSLRSANTADTYGIVINAFMKFCGGDVQHEKVLPFLRKVGINSMQNRYYGVKFFLNNLGEEMPVTLHDILGNQHIKRTKDVMSNDEIAAFIRTVRRDYGTIEIGYAALTTIYAARRVEAYNIAANDIEEDTLTIYAAKGGQERVHLIPAQLKDVMKDFKHDLKRIKKKPVITALNYFFDDVCDKALIELRPRMGFHSFRRSFISHMLNLEFNAFLLRDFCRWKTREKDIMANYYISDYRITDPKVFAVHPYLQYWE